MYHLRINDSSLFFEYWMDVVDFFINAGLTPETEYLNTTEGHNFYLFQIVGMGELWITNECIVERGDEYVSIELEKIQFHKNLTK
jgi:hypothetical protein